MVLFFSIRLIVKDDGYCVILYDFDHCVMAAILPLADTNPPTLNLPLTDHNLVRGWSAS
ncbi:MAG: hypothetical protein ABF893_18345 [Gluconacetobacter liquefaciens]